MDARRAVWTCVLIFVAGCSDVSSPEAEQALPLKGLAPPALTLSIVAPLGPFEPENEPPLPVIAPERIRTIGRHFAVIVTNASSKTQRLWETHNSWGYYNLRFEVVDPKGKLLYTIKKKETWFTLNNPSWIELAPGEHYLIHVNLDDKWELPFLKGEPQGDLRLRLRAVYESHADEEFKDHWVGRVTSPYQNYLLRYRR